ncbi:MAG: hypothetical protein PHU46_02975 [Rhodocyclaceae bacterium]|nr:hypothetical protein [Rhodocyclaceae bacterium]
MPRLKLAFALLLLLNGFIPMQAQAMGLLVGILGAPGTGMIRGPWSMGGTSGGESPPATPRPAVGTASEAASAKAATLPVAESASASGPCRFPVCPGNQR